MRGWQHGYLGAVLIFAGVYFENIWAIGIGMFVVLDELYQIITKDQYGGPLHWLYIKILYKIPLVRKINEWFDKLFGK